MDLGADRVERGQSRADAPGPLGRRAGPIDGDRASGRLLSRWRRKPSRPQIRSRIAIGGEGPVPTGVRLTMAGRINVGRWLSFTAEQEFSGHAFAWRARAAAGFFQATILDAVRVP